MGTGKDFIMPDVTHLDVLDQQLHEVHQEVQQQQQVEGELMCHVSNESPKQVPQDVLESIEATQ